MNYKSTRDAGLTVTAPEAILNGLAPDGGLYVPDSFGQLNWAALQGKDYCEVALAVLRLFLPQYSQDFLREALAQSYGENFGGKAGKLVCLDDGLFSLELWHGPTSAFKDYALQLMPKLLVEARRQLNETDETAILVATSGDTGKAALEGYKNLEGIKIAVFYPANGTSEVQRLQMVTQEGDNVAVYAVRGNFDDAQRGVKAAFCDGQLADILLERHKKLSSANSINWGRLVPQIVYYVTSYLQVCAQGAIQPGEPLDFCVPTGNFGDILAGYYAKAIGVPVGRLVCASNQNKVLADFFETGTYSTERDFYKTSSPSMDILVSSNLERLLYHESVSDAQVRGWMTQLADKGTYTVNEAVMDRIRATFAAGWANESQVSGEIRRIYDTYNYLCDPHTAVAFHVQQQLAATGGKRPTVVLSTANPYKFSGKVLAALGRPVPKDEFAAIAALEEYTGRQAPASLSSLSGKPVRFTEEIAPEKIAEIPLTL